MPPTRIGLIGLPSTPSWSTLAHLPYLLSSRTYTIVALCNSSLAAAQSSIATHALPPTTKAYSSPEALASDPDVDLVVCATRVDKHFACLVPALKAGKDVFCEWPLGKDAREAEEMAALAREKGVRTLVGLQAGVSPALRMVRRVVQEGRIGDVVSCVFHGSPGGFFGESVWEGHKWQQERGVGGNLLAIYGVHSLEGIQVVLGPLKEAEPLLAVRHPRVQLTDHTGAPTGTVERTSHDHFFLNGTFKSGAVLSYSLRGGKAFDGASGTFWCIYGTKGAIRITGPDSFLQVAEDNFTIELSEFGKEGVTELHADKDEYSGEEFPLFAKNVARLYEGFAEGKTAEEGVLSWEDAVKRHAFVEEMYRKAGVQ